MIFTEIKTIKFKEIFPDEETFLNEWKKYSTKSFQKEYLPDELENEISSPFTILFNGYEQINPSANIEFSESITNFKLIEIYFNSAYDLGLSIYNSFLLNTEILGLPRSDNPTRWNNYSISADIENDVPKTLIKYGFAKKSNFEPDVISKLATTSKSAFGLIPAIVKVVGIDRIAGEVENSLSIAKEMFKILEMNYSDHYINQADVEFWKKKIFTWLNTNWPSYYIFFNMELSKKININENGDLVISGSKNSKGNNFIELPESYSNFTFKKNNKLQLQQDLIKMFSTKQQDFIDELLYFFQSRSS